MTTPMVEAVGVTKSYGSVNVLRGDVQRVRVMRRDQDGKRPGKAVAHVFRDLEPAQVGIDLIQQRFRIAREGRDVRRCIGVGVARERREIAVVGIQLPGV